MLVKKLYQLMLLATVGLVPTVALADACVQKWNNLSAERIAGFQLWAESWEAYEPRRDRYVAGALAQAILVNHVRPNCAAQLQALGIDEGRYLAHLISQNFTAPGGGMPEYIPQQVMINRLAGPGLYLGLPRIQSQPVTRFTQSPRSEPAPARRPPVLPGCPSCMTAHSD